MTCASQPVPSANAFESWRDGPGVRTRASPAASATVNVGAVSGAYVTGPLPWPKNVSPPAATRLTCQGASETLTLAELLVSVYVTSMAPLSGTGVKCLSHVIAESATAGDRRLGARRAECRFAASMPPV